MNIIEKNKIIAEFMGLKKPYELPQHGTVRPNGSFKTEFLAEQLKYHSSWDWLMPVIKKILEISLDNENINMEYYYEITDAIPEIEDAYNKVIEFIKYYKKNYA